MLTILISSVEAYHAVYFYSMCKYDVSMCEMIDLI